jgi:hypothetical protein
MTAHASTEFKKPPDNNDPAAEERLAELRRSFDRAIAERKPAMADAIVNEILKLTTGQ